MSDRYVASSMTRISNLQDHRFRVATLLQESWGSGDYVVAEAVKRSGNWQVAFPGVRYVGHVMRGGHKVVMSDFAVRGGGALDRLLRERVLLP